MDDEFSSDEDFILSQRSEGFLNAVQQEYTVRNHSFVLTFSVLYCRTRRQQVRLAANLLQQGSNLLLLLALQLVRLWMAGGDLHQGGAREALAMSAEPSR